MSWEEEAAFGDVDVPAAVLGVVFVGMVGVLGPVPELGDVASCSDVIVGWPNNIGILCIRLSFMEDMGIMALGW